MRPSPDFCLSSRIPHSVHCICKTFFPLVLKLFSPIGTTTLQMFTVTLSPDRWNPFPNIGRTRRPSLHHRLRPTWKQHISAIRSTRTLTRPTTSISTQALFIYHNPTPSPPTLYREELYNTCHLEATEWSECSSSCGTGLSTRMSNRNAGCRMQLEARLCNIRPCHAVYTQVSSFCNSCYLLILFTVVFCVSAYLYFCLLNR